MPRLAVTAQVVDSADRPAIVLIHGSASSAGIWRYWLPALADLGWSSYALDLRGHGASSGELEDADMASYAQDVVSVVEQLARRPIVMGWSMGGLVATSVAAVGRAEACVAIAPSAPARDRDASAELRSGTFGIEEYDLSAQAPTGHAQWLDLDHEERAAGIESAALESRMARDTGRPASSSSHSRCPLLIVTGGRDASCGKDKYAGSGYRPITTSRRWQPTSVSCSPAASWPSSRHAWLAGSIGSADGSPGGLAADAWTDCPCDAGSARGRASGRRGTSLGRRGPARSRRNRISVGEEGSHSAVIGSCRMLDVVRPGSR